MVELADSIRKWLKDPQESERPPGFRRLPHERQQHKYRRTFVDFEPETIHCREDVHKLSVHELQAFVRSRVSNRLTRDRTELLSLACNAWNKPRFIHRNAVIPGELQDSNDFEKLTRDGLRIWINFRDGQGALTV